MVKIIFSILCLVLALRESLSLTSINCNFNAGYNFPYLGRIYYCDATSDPNILTEESSQINEIRGTHQSSKTNDDVLGFHIKEKTVQFFPKDLEKFFKNIKLVVIGACKLKEIHQSDLRVLTNLVFFHLWGNEIEVIEEGLFDFNPNLRVVAFYQETRIIHIDPNVFDNLNLVRYFWFDKVPCIDKDVSDSREKTTEMIKKIKSSCSSPEFITLDIQIKDLDIESRTLDSQIFAPKLVSFENIFKNSIFSNFRPLNYEFEILKKNEKCSNCRQLAKLESIESKLNSVSDNIVNGQNEIEYSFEDLKSSQCGLTVPVSEIKSSQSLILTRLDEIQSQTTNSINDVLNKVNQVSSTLQTLSTSLSNIESKINGLTSLFNSKFDDFNGKLNTLSGKIDNLNSRFGDLEGKINDKFEKNQDKIAEKLLKMTTKFDEKMKALEKRMLKTFKEILDLKLDELIDRHD